MEKRRQGDRRKEMGRRMGLIEGGRSDCGEIERIELSIKVNLVADRLGFKRASDKLHYSLLIVH
jgi:hypothetical protein